MQPACSWMQSFPSRSGRLPPRPRCLPCPQERPSASCSPRSVIPESSPKVDPEPATPSKSLRPRMPPERTARLSKADGFSVLGRPRFLPMPSQHRPRILSAWSRGPTRSGAQRLRVGLPPRSPSSGVGPPVPKERNRAPLESPGSPQTRPGLAPVQKLSWPCPVGYPNPSRRRARLSPARMPRTLGGSLRHARTTHRSCNPSSECHCQSCT
jgi:hypothetical protein